MTFSVVEFVRALPAFLASDDARGGLVALVLILWLRRAGQSARGGNRITW